jgi:hypothetical protein
MRLPMMPNIRWKAMRRPRSELHGARLNKLHGGEAMCFDAAGEL